MLAQNQTQLQKIQWANAPNAPWLSRFRIRSGPMRPGAGGYEHITSNHSVYCAQLRATGTSKAQLRSQLRNPDRLQTDGVVLCFWCGAFR